VMQRRSDGTLMEHMNQRNEDLVECAAETLQSIWSCVGQRVKGKVDELKRRPKEPLQFTPYQTGDFFMMKRGPRVYLQSKRKQGFKPTYKLRERWTGPFQIVKVINPILYDADVHGIVRRVHADNMKPGPPKRNKDIGLRDKCGSNPKLRN